MFAKKTVLKTGQGADGGEKRDGRDATVRKRARGQRISERERLPAEYAESRGKKDERRRQKRDR